MPEQTDIDALIREWRDLKGKSGYSSRGDRLADALESTAAELRTLRGLRDRWQETVTAPDFTRAVEAEARAYHESACSYKALSNFESRPVTDEMVEQARKALVRVDSVYLPRKIIRRTLEAALGGES